MKLLTRSHIPRRSYGDPNTSKDDDDRRGVRSLGYSNICTEYTAMAAPSTPMHTINASLGERYLDIDD